MQEYENHRDEDGTADEQSVPLHGSSSRKHPDEVSISDTREGYIHASDSERTPSLEPVQFYACSDVEIENFIVLRDQLPQRQRLMLTPYTAEEYKERRAVLYLANNNGGGYGILPDGEIVSVFSLPGYQLGRAIIEDAILRGGNKVECFDINNKLPELYRQFGFYEAGRIPWNFTQAPTAWSYEKYDTPDVIIMEIKLQ
jgi:hypothetical protein